MKVLMFGWEFPPNNWGGLGTACYGLSKALANQGVELTFVLPKGTKAKENEHLNLISTENLKIKNLKLTYINSIIKPYHTIENYQKEIDRFHLDTKDSSVDARSMYGNNLFEEVHRFAEKAKLVVMLDDYDVIHAHDWLTYKAGIKAKEITGKPLVVHMHATEFDRTGGNVNQAVYDIEREGLHKADRIIAVSNYTKNMVTKHYGIDPSKVEVVHNAVEHQKEIFKKEEIQSEDKIVLFLGRITLQKGPEYFIHAAKKALEHDPDIKFVIAGGGDMHKKMIELAADLGIGKNVLFTGYLRGPNIDKAYQMADLYVMPSVSEPFGITPLESLKNNTPVLISKQSGVSEILTNALKVDFWDIDEMSNKMLSALHYKSLNDTLTEEGVKELSTIKWDNAAKKCINVYESVRNR